MRLSTLSLIFVVALFLGSVPVQADSFVYSTINFPGAFQTPAYGINDSGAIVGAYHYEYVNNNWQGFLFVGGSFTTLNVPGSIATTAYGINDSGAIVGVYAGSSGGSCVQGCAFLDVGGNFTTINIPGVVDTQDAINDLGDIAGSYVDATGYHGFLYAGGSLTTINAPGYFSTYIYGINDSGEMVGVYGNSVGSCVQGCAFLDVGGNFTTINIPGSIWSYATGINDLGDIVGVYADATGNSHGFLDVGGNLSTIDIPDAIANVAFGINNSGDIVGMYGPGTAGTGSSGFLATPIPEPSTLALLGIGIVGLAGCKMRRS
jgi:probable HAF family extracellular repeat protein